MKRYAAPNLGFIVKNKSVAYFCAFMLFCTISTFSQSDLAISSLSNFKILDESGKVVLLNEKAAPEKEYHLSFDLIGYSGEKAYLFIGNNQVAVLKVNDSFLKGGKYTPTKKRALPKHFYFIPFEVDKDSLSVELLIKNATGFSNKRSLLKGSVVTPDWHEVRLFDEAGYLKKVSEIEAKDEFYIRLVNIFLGAIGFTAIFVLLLFLLNRQLSFFYYSAYLLSFFIFGIFHTRHYSDIGLWLSNYPVFHHLFPESVIWIGMFFYGYFSIYLLEITRENYPKIRTFIIAISWFSLVAGLLMAVPLLWTNNLQLNLDVVQWMRYLYSPLGLMGMILFLWKVKSNLKYLLVLGVGMWAILGNYSSTYALRDGYQLTSIGLGSNDAILWTFMGLLLESVMFSFALGVKMRNSEKERLAHKEELIEKMGELQKLKEDENLYLEKKIKEKSEELLKAYEQVENQKKRELEESYQKRIAISEMDALRSQMNPHFIFNSLSSIKHLVLTDQKDKSSAYLSKFAKLLRKILTFSRKDSVSLYEELENIKIYLELESERFTDQFKFAVKIGDVTTEDLENILIPSLLLQPYVENALLHGLRNSPRELKRVEINLEKQKGRMKIVIYDNGIGRDASQALKKEHSESLGTKITDERISLFNETYLTDIEVTYHDLQEGTQVVILV